MTASGVGGEGVEGLGKKEKGLMDMDNIVVIAVRRIAIKRLTDGNGKIQ